MRRSLLLAIAVLVGLLPIAIISSVFARDFETPAESSGLAASNHANIAVNMLDRTNGAVIGSDDFNYCTLNTALWTYTDPDGDATMNLNGQQLSISLPAGTTHDTWGTGPGNFSSNVPRIMQTVGDTDFEIEIKFDTQFSPTLANDEYQMEGALIEQDANDLMRLEFLRNGSTTRIFAATFVDGAATSRYYVPITESNPIYMRVTRVNDIWTQSFSDDGIDWTAMPSFSHPITVTAVGAYAGNSGASNEVLIDYFYNTDDLPVTGDVDEITLTTNVSPMESGTVAKNQDPPYQCSDEVELTASPNPGWSFSSWSGDLTGSTNPDTITMDGDKTVTANFTQSTFELTVTEVGNGDVSLNPPGGTYADGTVVTLTPVADPGWTFDEWTGDLSGSTNPTTITMDSDKAVTATFLELFTLTVTKVGDGNVTLNPPGGTYADGTVVTLTPVADPGWTFDEWTGDLSGSTNPTTITMDSDKAVTATFLELFTLTVTKVGDGNVTLNPPGGTYADGTVVTLTPVADPGWTFDEWTGDLSGSTNPTTITMDSDKAVTATFLELFTLTVTKVGDGNVTLNPPGGTYADGTVVTLTPVADPGWIFDEWTGDLSGSTNPTTITMDSDKAVTATFLELFTLTVTKVGDGNVTLNPPGGTYADGTVVTLTPVADPGWTFDEWTGDLSGSTNPTTITMDSDKAVTATFLELFTLTVTKVGDGNVTLNPTGGTYKDGTVVTLTPVADPGWTFDEWTGDLSGSTNPTTITMDSDKAVTATFLELFTLTVTKVGDGNVTLNPTGGTYKDGTVVTLTPVADPGWTFDEWTGDLSGSTNPTTITMDSDKAVTATFLELFTLTVTKVGDGNVTLNPTGGTYKDGTVVTLTPVADPGWTFDEWTGDLSGSTNPTTITMDSDKAVTATFTEDHYVLMINKVGNGSVLTDPVGTYTYGQVVTLTATADLGWIFSGWSGDLSGSTNPTTITMDSDKVVTATFESFQLFLPMILVNEPPSP